MGRIEFLMLKFSSLTVMAMNSSFQNLTWSEALRYCRQNHVDLVSVHSEEIQRRVMNVVKRASTAAVWLGLHNYCIMNMWLWVSGETVCYQNWAPGNGTKPENCKLEKRKGAVQDCSPKNEKYPMIYSLSSHPRCSGGKSTKKLYLSKSIAT
uniref:C-type lectin domain-containing protein n=1 Tax=Sinocyclocheilus rhinocerous TaxID=307959 RepID=A0A673MST4_9TELE